jgi:hypothetical protein
MSKQDEINALLDEAQERIEKLKNNVCANLTRTRRKKYKNKIVKCKCFDAWTDGDDYYFNQKLVDIQAYECSDGFYIRVTFMYLSLYSNHNDKPQPTSFYLEYMEDVT